MFDAPGEAARWFAQSERDLRAAAHARSGGFHEQACFLCLQAAEKALKSFLYLCGERLVLGHSVVQLLRSCVQQNQEFETLHLPCRRLDRYYLPTRYPDSLPGGAPYEAFGEEDSEPAVQDAEAVLERVRAELAADTDGEGPAALPQG